jgi:hypothetical protein
MLQMNQSVASTPAHPDEPRTQPQPEGEPPEPDADDGPDGDSNQVPDSVPDDWLDPKPFDPAGR